MVKEEKPVRHASKITHSREPYYLFKDCNYSAASKSALLAG
ncbi:MAG: hypothetical protein OJF58_004712 [Enhydrobacter sp.]|nr:MAG: hypothetical protein OJF58_004712 [Enhydrobacter sp.]